MLVLRSDCTLLGTLPWVGGQRHPDLEIAETPMRDWVKWDSGTSVTTYAARMAVSRAASARSLAI
jgi:hypothetical protein